MSKTTPAPPPPSPRPNGPPVVLEHFEEYPEQRDSVRLMVARHVGALPTWAHEAVVERYPRAAGETPAACYAGVKYRGVRVCLYSSFWSLTEEEQDRIILHEFVHALVAPLQDVANLALEHVPADARPVLDKILGEAVEGVVQDIRLALSRVQPPGPKRSADRA